MKKLKSLFGAAILMVFSGNLYAADIASTSLIQIKGIVTYSNDDPSSPAYSNLMDVSFDSIPWNYSSACSSTTVLVKSGDRNIVATVLSAYVSKTPVRVYVNDAVPPPQDGNCFLRAISTY